ncbi:fimbrial protein [Serratia fonticola]|uniref:fimbrial protein n=1 Tax=Serratia fonticola TaxID=47917 RepID=UPI000E0F05FF|nr:fimbrial protein [Serratia fonticola]
MHFLLMNTEGLEMYKIISASAFLLLLVLGAISQAGSAIVETGCAIATDSNYQTINLGSLPAGKLAQEHTRQLSIRLMSCFSEKNNKLLTDWRRFEISLDGGNDNGVFVIKGGPHDVVLQFTDYKGNAIMPGVSLSIIKTNPGEVLINYSLRPVASDPLLVTEGHTSTARLKLDYH